jgi:hypothetical protein
MGKSAVESARASTALHQPNFLSFLVIEVSVFDSLLSPNSLSHSAVRGISSILVIPKLKMSEFGVRGPAKSWAFSFQLSAQE